MEETLAFESSNELLNRLVEATRWSAKNNHVDVPTDCPTRERHGWTGDAQIFCDTAAYLFNYAPFARKYVFDMIDGQRKNGKFRQITPKGGIDFYMDFMDGSAGWSDAGVLIPYRVYKRYGDKKILESSYSAMKKYADFKIKTLGKRHPTAVKRESTVNIKSIFPITVSHTANGQSLPKCILRVLRILPVRALKKRRRISYICWKP